MKRYCSKFERIDDKPPENHKQKDLSEIPHQNHGVVKLKFHGVNEKIAYKVAFDYFRKEQFGHNPICIQDMSNISGLRIDQRQYLDESHERIEVARLTYDGNLLELVISEAYPDSESPTDSQAKLYNRTKAPWERQVLKYTSFFDVG